MKATPTVHKNRRPPSLLPLLFLVGLLTGASPARTSLASPLDGSTPVVLALVIGNNLHLEDPGRTLRYADDDALRVAQTLQTLVPDSRLALLVAPDDETRRSGSPFFPPDPLEQAPVRSAPVRSAPVRSAPVRSAPVRSAPVQTGSITIGPPTLAGLELALRTLTEAAQAQPERPSKLLVYFSGHGEPGGTLHLADGYLPAARLKTMLARVGARQVFALTDACFGAGLAARGAGRAQGIPSGRQLFPQDTDLVPPKTPDWLGVIAAASSTPEAAALRGGLLTFTALGGLAGPADLSGDGILTFFEWGRYIRMQLERSPEAGDIQVRPLARDPLASVLTFHALGPPTLVIGPTYPTGLIQVLKADGKPLLLQHFHSSGQTTRFFLEPGAYRLRRLQQTHPDARALLHGLRAYPIEEQPLTLTLGKTLHLEGGSSPDAAWLVVGTRRGTDPLPDQVPHVPIGFDDERLFAGYGLERRTRWGGLTPTHPLPESHWSLAIKADPPWGGLKLSSQLVTPTPGFGIRLARQRALDLSGRWLFSGSVQAGYGLTFQPDACCDPETLDKTVDALTHRLRLGLGLSQTWVGPYWRLLMETRLSYAPQVSTTQATAGMHPLGDPVHPLDWNHLSQHRAFQWMQGEGELATAMLFPLTSRWEIGPVLQLVGVAGRLPGRAYAVPMLTLGLELRPATIR